MIGREVRKTWNRFPWRLGGKKKKKKKKEVMKKKNTGLILDPGRSRMPQNN